LDAFFLCECVRDQRSKIVDFRVVEVNDRAALFLGRPREEIVGRLASELTPELQAHGFIGRCIDVVRSGQTLLEEMQTTHPVHGSRSIRVQVVRVDDGIAVTARDITGRRQVERSLAETEARFRNLVESASDGIYRIDPRGFFTYANPIASRLLGFPPDAAGIVGHHFLEFVRRDYHEQGVTLYSTQVKERIPVTYWEFPVITQAGAELWIGQKVHIEERDGWVTSLFAVARDITDRRRLEDELRHAQKMEAVVQVAGGVAHDFNNALTTIRGFADLLSKSLDSGDARRQDLAEILRATERAAALTRQLLAFSRRQVLSPETHSVNTTVTAMVRIISRLLGDTRPVETHLADALWPVRADPGQLEQVLLSLAVNARDAMPVSGTLRITTRNETVGTTHSVLAPGDYVVLEVSDNGAGMTDEARLHIFEPFFTTKDPHEHPGLGLATVYGIVAQSGGHVSVSSRQGAGTMFTMHLPVAAETHNHTRTPARASGARPAGNTVIVAEDNEGVRAFTARLLEGQGFDVRQAADGVHALEITRELPMPPVLLVTDVMMPRMNGSELASHFAQLFPGTPVMFISGYMDEATVRRNFHDRDAIVLQKPFAPEALIRQVNALVRANR
jgi:PAS domain S-box-containing protein